MITGDEFTVCSLIALYFIDTMNQTLAGHNSFFSSIVFFQIHRHGVFELKMTLPIHATSASGLWLPHTSSVDFCEVCTLNKHPSARPHRTLLFRATPLCSTCMVKCAWCCVCLHFFAVATAGLFVALCNCRSAQCLDVAVLFISRSRRAFLQQPNPGEALHCCIPSAVFHWIGICGAAFYADGVGSVHGRGPHVMACGHDCVLFN